MEQPARGQIEANMGGEALDAVAPPRPAEPEEEKDAGRGEIMLYAFGNIEGAIAGKFFEVLQTVMIVAMQINPLLIGLMLGIKTFWDAVTDPIMAFITDNTKSRWGRRIPYILAGGVSRIAMLVVVIAFFPRPPSLASNLILEGNKKADEALAAARGAGEEVAKALTAAAAGKPGAGKQLAKAAAEAEKAMSIRDAIARYRPAMEAHAAEKRQRAAARRAELGRAEAGLAAEDRGRRESAIQTDLRVAAETEGKILLFGFAEERLPLNSALSALAREVAAGARNAAEALREAEERLDAQSAAEKAGMAGLAQGAPAAATGKRGAFSGLVEGWRAFWDPENTEQRGVIVYVLMVLLLFTTLTTVQSVPYFALGIELAPSYDGRTRVVTYRSVMDKIAGLAAPWVPVFCFLPMFGDALDGLFWVAVAACVVGIPSTVLMAMFVRERLYKAAAGAKRRMGLLTSMWHTAKNRVFLRIFALYLIVGLSMGLFGMIGGMLNIYWVMGSALAGAKIGAAVSMVAWVLGLFTLPAINWGCKRFQKHVVLRVALVLMSAGTVLKWWCYQPGHPEYQFILPFFFSVGIGSYYAVLSTLMADVTDYDELLTGTRREGMFGATMAFLTKLVGTFTPILAGAILVLSGFDPVLEYHQSERTILNMRLMFSIVPGTMLLTGLVILANYPLTRQRMEEIKAELKVRRAQAAAAAS